jgi:hypothetical protein
LFPLSPLALSHSTERGEVIDWVQKTAKNSDNHGQYMEIIYFFQIPGGLVSQWKSKPAVLHQFLMSFSPFLVYMCLL